MQNPPHFLDLAFRDTQLVDYTGGIRILAEGACPQIFMYKPPIQGIARILPAEAVQLLKLPVKRD
ncbi:hypothetical protein D3C80_2217290 [compost metagenome]